MIAEMHSGIMEHMPLDLAVGILLSLGLSALFGVEPTGFIVAVGIAAAFLPDVDVILLALVPPIKKIIGEHRSVLHYPLLYVPIVAMIWMAFGTFFALLIGLGVLWHFIHDTIFLGWGLAWLAPFSMRKWKLFPVYGAQIHWREGLVTWLPDKEPALRKAWLPADWDDRTWIHVFYLRPHFVGLHEYVILAFALWLLWCVWW